MMPMRKSLPLLLLSFLLLSVHSQPDQACEQTDGASATTAASVLVTPSDQLGPFYYENSPQTSQMGPLASLNDPLSRLEVYGHVLLASESSTNGTNSGNTSCRLGLANVTMEVWFAGPPDAEGDYYQPNDYRGQITTDHNGAYRFVQTFPALYPTQPILHNHVRISAMNRNGANSTDNDVELLVTQMYFAANDTEGWTEANGYVGIDGGATLEQRDLQTAFIERNGTTGSRMVQFDLYIDAVAAANADVTVVALDDSNDDDDAMVSAAPAMLPTAIPETVFPTPLPSPPVDSDSDNNSWAPSLSSLPSRAPTPLSVIDTVATPVAIAQGDSPVSASRLPVATASSNGSTNVETANVATESASDSGSSSSSGERSAASWAHGAVTMAGAVTAYSATLLVLLQ